MILKVLGVTHDDHVPQPACVPCSHHSSQPQAPIRCYLHGGTSRSIRKVSYSRLLDVDALAPHSLLWQAIVLQSASYLCWLVWFLKVFDGQQSSVCGAAADGAAADTHSNTGSQADGVEGSGSESEEVFDEDLLPASVLFYGVRGMLKLHTGLILPTMPVLLFMGTRTRSATAAE